MSVQTKQYAYGTTVTVRYPFGLYMAARVMCPDGVVRATSRIAETADTFFSVPCAVKAYGKTVAGYMTTATRGGLSTATDDDPLFMQFIPYTYRKNHGVFTRRAQA